jgi:hypothetical protein
MRRIEIERDLTTHTPVTEDILDMLAKLKAWTPKTLEQVIEVGNRLIHAANGDIFCATTKKCKSDKVRYFMDMKGKMIKYPLGIARSVEYIYVTRVEFDHKEWDTTVKLTGVRLSKYNRIGNDIVQLYTLPIQFGSVLDMKEDSVTTLEANCRVEYTIVSDYAEYKDAVSRMKAFVPMLQDIPEFMTQDMIKISLRRKSVTKGKAKDDNRAGDNKPFGQGDEQCQNQLTSTTTSKAESKSCEEPSDTTSSSPATTGNGTGRRTPRPRVSGTSRKIVSRKSPRSSKSS